MKSLIHLTLAAALCAALTVNEAYGQTNVARTGRFFRGTGTNTSYQSFVLPPLFFTLLSAFFDFQCSE